jgi:hypothetical protein
MTTTDQPAPMYVEDNWHPIEHYRAVVGFDDFVTAVHDFYNDCRETSEWTDWTPNVDALLALLVDRLGYAVVQLTDELVDALRLVVMAIARPTAKCREDMLRELAERNM